MKRNKSPPPSQSTHGDWLPANRLAGAGFDQSTWSLKRKLIQLRDALVKDLIAAGHSDADALDLVEHNLIGTRNPRTGRTGLHASPDALNLLSEADRTADIPRVPDGWISAHQMQSTHLIGDLSKRNKRLESFRSGLIRDVTSSGIGEDDSASIIDHNLIGRKRPHYGPPTLYASPDAVGMMEREGLIRRKEPTSFAERVQRPSGGKSID